MREWFDRHVYVMFYILVILGLAFAVNVGVQNRKNADEHRAIVKIEHRLCASGAARGPLLHDLIVTLTQPNVPVPGASPELVAQIGRANDHKLQERVRLLGEQGPLVAC